MGHCVELQIRLEFEWDMSGTTVCPLVYCISLLMHLNCTLYSVGLGLILVSPNLTVFKSFALVNPLSQ